MDYLYSHAWFIPFAFALWLLAAAILWVRPKEVDKEGNIILRYIGAHYMSLVLSLVCLSFGVVEWFDQSNHLYVGNLILFSYIPIFLSIVMLCLTVYFWSFRITLRSDTIELHIFSLADIKYDLDELTSVLEEKGKYVLIFKNNRKLIIYQNMSGRESFIELISKRRLSNRSPDAIRDKHLP